MCGSPPLRPLSVDLNHVTSEAHSHKSSIEYEAATATLELEVVARRMGKEGPFKVVLLGDPEVGKSALIRCLMGLDKEQR